VKRSILFLAPLLLSLLAPLASAYVSTSIYFFNASSGVWYAVNTNGQPYRVYYYDASGNMVYVTAYWWDANPSYIIFQSPINGRIYLRQESYSLSTLSTVSWFSGGPSAFTASVNIPAPWNTVLTASFSYNKTDTVTFNGNTLNYTAVYSFSSSSVKLYYEYTSAGVTAGASYTITLSTTPSDFKAKITSASFSVIYWPANYVDVISNAVLNTVSGNTVYYYTVASVVNNATSLSFTLSATQSSVSTTSSSGNKGTMSIYVAPDTSNYTYTRLYMVSPDGYLSGNGVTIRVFNSLDVLSTSDVLASSSTYVYYLYTQDASITINGPVYGGSILVIPLDTVSVAQSVKNPVVAVYDNVLGAWSSAWVINYGAGESFILYIPPYSSRMSYNISIVYNYPVKYTAPPIEYTYTSGSDMLSFFAVNGTVENSLTYPVSTIFKGEIALGNYIGSTLLLRLDPQNTGDYNITGAYSGYINTGSVSYLVLYVYSPDAMINGTIAVFSALVLRNMYTMMNYNVNTAGSVALRQWPLTMISYVTGGNIVGSWSYRIPIYVTLSELPSYIGESGFVFRFKLPLMDWINAGLLSPSLEDLMFTDASSQPLPFYVLDVSRGIVYVRYNAQIATNTLVIYVLLKNPSLWGSGTSFSNANAVFDAVNPRDIADDFGYNTYATYLSMNALTIIANENTNVKIGKTWYDFVGFNSTKLWEQHGSIVTYNTTVSSFKSGDEVVVYINRQDFDNVLVYANDKPLFSFKLSDYSSSPAYYVGYQYATVYAYRMLMYSYAVGSIVGGYQPPPPVNKVEYTPPQVQFDWFTFFMVMMGLIGLGLVFKWISTPSSGGEKKPISLP